MSANDKINHYFKKRILKIKVIQKQDTLPERLFEDILKTKEIMYIKQYSFLNSKFIYDFYLPEKNLLVEIDGDYWHGNPRKFRILDKVQKHNNRNDVIKTKLAVEKNTKLVRIWEYDIKNSTAEFKKTLKEIL